MRKKKTSCALQLLQLRAINKTSAVKFQIKQEREKMKTPPKTENGGRLKYGQLKEPPEEVPSSPV